MGTANDMNWEREPTLNARHIKGTMAQHNGRVQILGGTGMEGCDDNEGCDSVSDTNTIEYLNQNGIINEDGSVGSWSFGKESTFGRRTLNDLYQGFPLRFRWSLL